MTSSANYSLIHRNSWRAGLGGGGARRHAGYNSGEKNERITIQYDTCGGRRIKRADAR